jgi:cell division transport system permease protein
MFNSIKRIIGLGWQNLARDGGIAVANVFIIMIPILLTTVLFVGKDVSDFLVKELQQKADVSIYFNESVAEDAILQVKDEIGRIPGISRVDYVSRDAALEAFRKRHENDKVLLESLDEINGNPLLASLNVSAESAGQFDRVTELLASEEYKDLVNKANYSERKDIIDKVFSITAGTQRIGLILFVILGVISVMVTFNTVRIAILSRKVEIGIQRLVGASRWFIRGQFLVEGLIFGLLAAIFSFFVAAAASWYISPALAKTLPGMDLWQNFTANLWTITWIQLGIGAGLGMFSSILAISRHLKV